MDVERSNDRRWRESHGHPGRQRRERFVHVNDIEGDGLEEAADLSNRPGIETKSGSRAANGDGRDAPQRDLSVLQ